MLLPRWPSILIRPFQQRRVHSCSVGRAHSCASVGSHTTPATQPEVKHTMQLRLYVVSDVHTDYEDNMHWVRSLPVHLGSSVLIVAGDVSDSLVTLRETLTLFKSRFWQVFFTPGNHDLWVHGMCSAADGAATSPAKLLRVLQTCRELGVHTGPRQLGRLWVVPLLSWHHCSWDREPDVPGIPRASLMTISDYGKCAWPHAGGADHGQTSTAELVDSLNDGAALAAVAHAASAQASMASPLPAHRNSTRHWGALPATCGQVARQDSSTPNAKEGQGGLLEGQPACCNGDVRACRDGCRPEGQQGSGWASASEAASGVTVVSFSHFVPHQSLLPEKRFLMYPPLAKAVGSDKLASRVGALRPDMHVFGHTHFAWDAVIGGTRYVQAPLCYPKERRSRLRTVRLRSTDGRQPNGEGPSGAQSLPQRSTVASLAVPLPPPVATPATGCWQRPAAAAADMPPSAARGGPTERQRTSAGGTLQAGGGGTRSGSEADMCSDDVPEAQDCSARGAWRQWPQQQEQQQQQQQGSMVASSAGGSGGGGNGNGRLGHGRSGDGGVHTEDPPAPSNIAWLPLLIYQAEYSWHEGHTGLAAVGSKAVSGASAALAARHEACANAGGRIGPAYGDSPKAPSGAEGCPVMHGNREASGDGAAVHELHSEKAGRSSGSGSGHSGEDNSGASSRGGGDRTLKTEAETLQRCAELLLGSEEDLLLQDGWAAPPLQRSAPGCDAYSSSSTHGSSGSGCVGGGSKDGHGAAGVAGKVSGGPAHGTRHQLASWEERFADRFSAVWSDYYNEHERTPENVELAPWVAPRWAKHLARRAAAATATAEAATLAGDVASATATDALQS